MSRNEATSEDKVKESLYNKFMRKLDTDKQGSGKRIPALNLDDDESDDELFRRAINSV